ncbi:general transcription factor IIH subunit 5-like [Saccoglossus kowalevskii]
MVNVMRGVLVECDPVMKQFLLHLDESNVLGKKFIIQELDETHLFISADIVDILQDKIDELMDQNAYPVLQK